MTETHVSLVRPRLLHWLKSTAYANTSRRGKFELSRDLLGKVYSEKTQKKGPQLGVKPMQNSISAFAFVLLIRFFRYGASMKRLPQLLVRMPIPFTMRLLEIKYPLELLAAQRPRFDLM
jgi:hypothetical protein